jgi:E3 ubiquitin-protein ligase HUWE1
VLIHDAADEEEEIDELEEELDELDEDQGSYEGFDGK